MCYEGIITRPGGGAGEEVVSYGKVTHHPGLVQGKAGLSPGEDVQKV